MTRADEIAWQLNEKIAKLEKEEDFLSAEEVGTLENEIADLVEKLSVADTRFY